jgi:hypothetical protein
MERRLGARGAGLLIATLVGACGAVFALLLLAIDAFMR